MSNGRTIWWAKDCAWWRREWIVVLGEEFGPAGPAVIDWLSCEAKAQNDGGWVKTGRRSVSRGCFVPLVTVGHVLSRSVTLGLLEDFSELNDRFQCRISGWRSDQERGQAAARKQASRDAKRAANGGLEPNPGAGQAVTSHALSRPVTVGHKMSLTEENRREKELLPPLPPQDGGEGDVSSSVRSVDERPPVRPARDRHLPAYHAQLVEWCAVHLPGLSVPVSQVESEIAALEARGVAPTAALVRGRIERWTRDAA